MVVTLSQTRGLDFFSLREVASVPDVEPLKSFGAWETGALAPLALREHPPE